MPSEIKYEAISGFISQPGIEGASQNVGHVPTDKKGNAIGKVELL